MVHYSYEQQTQTARGSLIFLWTALSEQPHGLKMNIDFSRVENIRHRGRLGHTVTLCFKNIWRNKQNGNINNRKKYLPSLYKDIWSFSLVQYKHLDYLTETEVQWSRYAFQIKKALHLTPKIMIKYCIIERGIYKELFIHSVLQSVLEMGNERKHNCNIYLIDERMSR